MSTVSTSVKCGHHRIPILVDFGRRRRLYIVVHPDLSVIVKAPRRESLAVVMQFVRQRAQWIQRKVAHFEQLKPYFLERRAVDGEPHLYLGKQYTLRLIPAAEDKVRLRGRYLTAWTPDPGKTRHVQQLVADWYYNRADELLRKRLLKCYESALLPDVPVPELHIWTMIRSWGTCSSHGLIRLNSELVKTPGSCIDYVITHELCHLKHQNHSKAFYRLVTRCMPDWEERKARLDRYVI